MADALSFLETLQQERNHLLSDTNHPNPNNPSTNSNSPLPIKPNRFELDSDNSESPTNQQPILLDPFASTIPKKTQSPKNSTPILSTPILSVDSSFSSLPNTIPQTLSNSSNPKSPNLPTQEKKEHEYDEDEDDDDDDDDDDEEDNKELMKEMEKNFEETEKEKKEKKERMLHLLTEIKNKKPKEKIIQHKKTKGFFVENKTSTRKERRIKKLGINNIKKVGINPLKNNSSNIRIVFDNEAICNYEKNVLDKSVGSPLKKKESIGRRNHLKKLLKKNISKQRSKEMKKYKKEFGKEEIPSIPNDSQPKLELEMEMNWDDEKHEELDTNLSLDLTMSLDGEEEDDIELDVDKYVDEKGEGLDEEDEARLALMEKEEIIPKEMRKYFDITAEEEDEQGNIVAGSEDEYESKYGVVKNLIATKKDLENDAIEKNREVDGLKRIKLDRLRKEQENDQELKLIQSAFVDGNYEKLRRKRANHLVLEGDEDVNAQYEVKFESRNSIFGLKAEDYLSDNEEKNEYCVYNKNGEFNDIITIRLKIFEWQKKHLGNKMIVSEDEELDENVKNELQKKRMEKQYKKEQLLLLKQQSKQNEINIINKSESKLLQKIRNKKSLSNNDIIPKQKHKLIRELSNSNLINFGSFYKKEGLEPMTRSGSFLMDNKNECKQKISTNQTKSNILINDNSTTKSKKAFIFNTNNKGSRKRKGRSGESVVVFNKNKKRKL